MITGWKGWKILVLKNRISCVCVCVRDEKSSCFSYLFLATKQHVTSRDSPGTLILGLTLIRSDLFNILLLLLFAATCSVLMCCNSDDYRSLNKVHFHRVCNLVNFWKMDASGKPGF